MKDVIQKSEEDWFPILNYKYEKQMKTAFPHTVKEYEFMFDKLETDFKLLEPQKVQRSYSTCTWVEDLKDDELKEFTKKLQEEVRGKSTKRTEDTIEELTLKYQETKKIHPRGKQL